MHNISFESAKVQNISYNAQKKRFFVKFVLISVIFHPPRGYDKLLIVNTITKLSTTYD